MYPPMQCENSEYNTQRIRHKQEVSKVGETMMFCADKSCELLNHSVETSYALKEINEKLPLPA